MEPLSRTEILTILSSMGVELPPSTKLPDEALAKRLKQAINAAQYLTKVIPAPPLNIASVPAWPPYSPDSQAANSVHDAVRRDNLGCTPDAYGYGPHLG
ncbi:hypothetical protein BKA93DRAFT_259435 [Sparassis latifolia]